MGALTDLWKSERGLLALAIIICATVLLALDKISVSDWKEINIAVYGVYGVSKGATGVAAIVRDRHIRTAAISAIKINPALSDEAKNKAVADVAAQESTP